MIEDRIERLRYLAGASADMTNELRDLLASDVLADEDLKRAMALANAVRTATYNLVRAAHAELVERGADQV